jgi:signal transduction histidine kinase/CheY-like chemotaxis protein
MHVCFVGVFGFSSVHYAIQWWFSRDERTFLVFAIGCVLMSAFCWEVAVGLAATSVPESHDALTYGVTLGVLSHVAILHLYAHLANRSDHAFLGVVSAVFVGLAFVNLWAPLRGTVVDLQPVVLPGGSRGFIPIRTGPSALLPLLYIAVLVAQGYGCFVARRIWQRRDRLGAALVVVGATMIVGVTMFAALVDFAGMRAPYLGAGPFAIFVLCMGVFLSREYSVRATKLRSNRNRLEELVATRTRELRDAKDEAERASTAKSRFLAHMSHEIRTPLGVILTYAQLLQRDRTIDDKQRKKVDVMFSSGKHLLALLNDVLEMSKIEAGHSELVEDRFDPWTILEEVKNMFLASTAAKGVELTIERSPELPRALLGDSAKVKQILINLAGNAVKFTTKGAIRIQASASPLLDELTRVEIVVADTGIGIAADDLKRMFQPFEQLEAGARVGGTGLGLAISLAHARLMGGDITAESTPGVGTTFKVTFQAKRVPAQEPARSEMAPAHSAVATRRKVLIVDDLQINRDVLVELLAQPKFETRTAADGSRALAIHSDWSPDVVLMDLQMPQMSGLEAIRRMRDAGSTAAFGVLTASGLAEDERDALAIGVDFFLRKPYDARELLDRIDRVLVGRAKAD